MNFKSEDGVYLVKELPNDLVYDSVAFFVSLPDYSRCDESGTPAYTITASPKNTIREEKVEIEKDVTALDREHDTFDVGVDHTWIIQSSIPYAIATGKQYEVSDTLDRRLTLAGVGNVALAKDNGTFGNSEESAYKKDDSETPAGEEILILQKDVDYTLVCGKTEDNLDTFTVALTSAGMRKIASTVDQDNQYELRIYFTAQINTNAALGEKISNQASVTYTNNLYKTYFAESDQPEVHTGGIQLLKVDSRTNQPLAGATFCVYREAGPYELSDSTIVDFEFSGTTHHLIPVSFYANAAMDGEKVTSFTTGADGVGFIYGNYYLLETQAPEGYNKLPVPTSFTIDANSHKEGNQLTVSNTAGVELPATGGIGTQPFTILGLLLIGTAATVLAQKKRHF